MWFWVGTDEGAARLRLLAAADGFVQHAPADPVAGLEHEHGAVVVHELARGGQAGEAGADHHHVGATRGAPATPPLRCLGLRHAGRQRGRARDRPGFEQLAPADGPLVQRSRSMP